MLCLSHATDPEVRGPCPMLPVPCHQPRGVWALFIFCVIGPQVHCPHLSYRP